MISGSCKFNLQQEGLWVLMVSKQIGGYMGLFTLVAVLWPRIYTLFRVQTVRLTILSAWIAPQTPTRLLAALSSQTAFATPGGKAQTATYAWHALQESIKQARVKPELRRALATSTTAVWTALSTPSHQKDPHHARATLVGRGHPGLAQHVCVENIRPTVVQWRAVIVKQESTQYQSLHPPTVYHVQQTLLGGLEW